MICREISWLASTCDMFQKWYIYILYIYCIHYIRIILILAAKNLWMCFPFKDDILSVEFPSIREKMLRIFTFLSPRSNYMKCIEIHARGSRQTNRYNVGRIYLSMYLRVFFSICIPTFHPKGTDILISLVGCMVLASVLGLSIVVAFRSYFRSVALLEQKLQRTSFDTVHSMCCQCGHLDASGNTLVCDREALKFLSGRNVLSKLATLQIVHGETFVIVEWYSDIIGIIGYLFLFLCISNLYEYMLFVSSQVKYECSVVLSCSIYQHDLSSKWCKWMNELIHCSFFTSLAIISNGWKKQLICRLIRDFSL